MTNVGICLAEAKRYPAFTVFPFYHESGCMPWAAAVTIHMDNFKDIIFLVGISCFFREGVDSGDVRKCSQIGAGMKE